MEMPVSGIFDQSFLKVSDFRAKKGHFENNV